VSGSKFAQLAHYRMFGYANLQQIGSQILIKGKRTTGHGNHLKINARQGVR
jgi:hypothetical protein